MRWIFPWFSFSSFSFESGSFLFFSVLKSIVCILSAYARQMPQTQCKYENYCECPNEKMHGIEGTAREQEKKARSQAHNVHISLKENS